MAPDKTSAAGVVPARLNETAVNIDGPEQAAAAAPVRLDKTAVQVVFLTKLYSSGAGLPG
jgi:hypothetical protein